MDLFPRLALPRARALAARYSGAKPERLRSTLQVAFDGARFAPTGGTRVTRSKLEAVRGEIETIADGAGWPRPDVAARRQFDREVVDYLGQCGWPPGEMLRPEVWAWITVHLVPHVVAWRFGRADNTVALERFAGALQRNALGRLWLRAWVFDRGAAALDRWLLARVLSEDAAVAILERTALASDHRFACAIAHQWNLYREAGVSGLEGVLRAAMKRLRIAAVVQDTMALESDSLALLVRDAFEAALKVSASDGHTGVGCNSEN